MSKLKSFSRKLNPQKVWFANQVSEERLKVARQVVLDRAKKDAEFAADVLKAVGEYLPSEIKEACETSVKEAKSKTMVTQGSSDVNPTVTDFDLEKVADKAIDELIQTEGDLTYKMVPVQTDGGGTILVNETETLDYPRDGEKS